MQAVAAPPGRIQARAGGQPIIVTRSGTPYQVTASVSAGTVNVNRPRYRHSFATDTVSVVSTMSRSVKRSPSVVSGRVSVSPRATIQWPT
jgi:hypothetical protein